MSDFERMAAETCDALASSQARIQELEACVKQLMDAGTYLLGVQANPKLKVTANNKFEAALETARALHKDSK